MSKSLEYYEMMVARKIIVVHGSMKINCDQFTTLICLARNSFCANVHRINRKHDTIFWS